MKNSGREELYNDLNNRFIKLLRRGKKPIEKGWNDQNNYSYNSAQIQQRLKEGGNVGLLTGVNGLLVVDFDDKKLQDEVLHQMPVTLTQKTGSGGLHLIYRATEGAVSSFKVVDEQNNTRADIQAKDRMIVIAPSIHPNGKPYELINNEPIQTISVKEIRHIFEPYIIVGSNAEKKQYLASGANTIQEQKPDLKNTLWRFGVDVSRNPTACPWHNSKKGQCFGFNEEKQIWHCFGCEKSGDVITFVQENDSCDFKTACRKLGIELRHLGGV